MIDLVMRVSIAMDFRAKVIDEETIGVPGTTENLIDVDTIAALVLSLLVGTTETYEAAD